MRRREAMPALLCRPLFSAPSDRAAPLLACCAGSRALFLWPGKAHDQLIAVQLNALAFTHGLDGLLFGGHLHKSKTPRPARIFILDDLCRQAFPEIAEIVLEIGGGYDVRQITYIYFIVHGRSFLVHRVASGAQRKSPGD